MEGVGDYAFLRELGRGAHGRVYLAKTPGRLRVGDDQVAVKVLSGPATDDAFDAVVAELSAIDALRSEQLVRLYDVGLDAGTLFYAMEFHPWGSLAAPMQQLSRPARLQAVARAARAAHELHEAGIVHRAVSPSNVLLRRTGAVLAEPGVGHLVTQGRTIAGLGQGAGGVSLELVDPRVMRGEPAGRSSDIWSLGVTLHLALAGCGLFPALVSADPLLAVRIYVRSQPEPDESLSEAERAIVVRAVQPDPARRYRTAAELADDIERVARLSPVGAP